MVHIKIMQFNKNGKIELTKEELEDIIEQAYQDGKDDDRFGRVFSSVAKSGYDLANTCNATKQENK